MLPRAPAITPQNVVQVSEIMRLAAEQCSAVDAFADGDQAVRKTANLAKETVLWRPDLMTRPGHDMIIVLFVHGFSGGNCPTRLM